MRPLAPRIADQVLAAHWPEAACELDAKDPFALLVAVILSARARDEQVNKVLAVLHEHLLGIDAYARLDPRDLEPLLRHLPLYRQKARAVVEAARTILERHGGAVPRDLEALARLPGVGRKTAAVVVANAYGVPAIGADTHVQRLAHRWGWTTREHPAEAETAVADRLPRHRWIQACHQMIRLGRTFCTRLRPRCDTCPLAPSCPRVGAPA